MKNTNVIKLNFGPKMLLAFCLLLTSTFTASAQKSAVLDAFSKHGIDAGILNPDNLKRPDDYAFDFKQTVTTTGKQNITVARFDPSGPKEEQWTVVSVDGKTPSKGDINSFRKNQAKSETPLPDDSSYKIEKENSGYLVISFKMDPNSIPKDASFMKDCKSYLSVNLRTKRLEQSQIINEKPVKIKILSADKFEGTLKYNWNAQAKRYFSATEDVNIQAKFIGQAVNVQTSTEYSNYTRK
ncbi:hypothetical protein DBR11_24995 [Pedobacter sp. HMWF019]|uniref:hypothetical protein n=1 Tax=Pedobacter sp. HMWF019 TaxID=2056856 RepID=UPI000D3A3609|nr:hypothetical protein [Pedobacter sp. HMWF019]PTS93600.1 hypothetical protein DBR11_24995 [Pedobacter sp. HMWF019]